MNKQLRFDGIKKLIVMGGGQTFLEFVVWLREHTTFEILCLTSPRHLNDILRNQETLEKELKLRNILYHSLNSLSPQNLIEFGINPESTLAISISSPWIIKKDFLEFLKRKVINLHYTFLPSYRGGAGCSWQLMNGEVEGGCTLHILDEGIDTGDLLLQEKVYYSPEMTPADCNLLYESASLKLLSTFVSDYINNHSILGISQDEKKAMYFPRLNTEKQGWIDWSWEAVDIVNFIRAFDDPYKGAHTFLNGKVVYLKSAKLMTQKYFHPFQRGLIVQMDGEGFYIVAPKGLIRVETITDETKKEISGIKLGDRLFTPVSVLEEAISTRVFYNAQGIKS